MNIKQGTFTAAESTQVEITLGFRPNYIAIWTEIDRISSHDMSYGMAYLYLNGETAGLMHTNDKSYGSGTTHEGIDYWGYASYINIIPTATSFAFKNTFNYAGSDPVLYSYLAIE